MTGVLCTVHFIIKKARKKLKIEIFRNLSCTWILYWWKALNMAIFEDNWINQRHFHSNISKKLFWKLSAWHFYWNYFYVSCPKVVRCITKKQTKKPLVAIIIYNGDKASINFHALRALPARCQGCSPQSC